MAEGKPQSSELERFVLPYRSGEFQEVAQRLDRLAASLATFASLNFVTQEIRGAATALTRAEQFLTAATGGQPEIVSAVADMSGAKAATSEQLAREGTAEVGARGEWHGNVGRQPQFDRIPDGRIRGVFFLAQHPVPDSTEWVRCYSLGRHAEALQKKGRLAGAEVVVRGTLQGVKQLTQRDGSVVDQQTVYCYGVRVVRVAKTETA